MARHRLLLFVVTTACALGVAASVDARAQDLPPAHVSYVAGSATVEHDATTEPAEPNLPLHPGDRLLTQAGRAEVVFGDGSVVHVDEYTTIDLLSDRLIRLLAGRLMVMAGSGLAGHLQIDAAAGSVRVVSAGEYRIALLAHGAGADLELAVIRGSAELFTDADGVALRAGQRAMATVAGALAGPWPFNSAAFDAFDRWSQGRLDARRGTASSQYLPGELHHYAGAFDHYGTWSHEPSYGYVWSPRVSHEWRPYYHGRWRHYPRWGWTWIGGPRWAWPTHHFGRWGVTAGGSWFWIPGRVWSGAWVHWGVAPGYVSWCPLGFDNRPLFAFWSPHRRHPFDSWRGWTVVHRAHFGAKRAVHVVALDGRRLVTQGTTFVTQDRPPVVTHAVQRAGTVPRDLAVPRARTAPPNLAVPRGETPSAARVGPGSPQRSGRASAGGDGRATIRSQPPAASQPSQPAAGRTWGQAVRRGAPAETTPPTDRTGNAEAPAIPDLTPFRSRSGRTAQPGASQPSSRPEDVPVYRGGVRSYGRPPARESGPSSSPSEPAAPPPPARVAPRGGDQGGEAPRAVPRARSGAWGGSAPSGGESAAPARGRSGVPSTAGAPAASAPPPPAGQTSGGGRARSAPSGGGGGGEGRAVSRGSGGGGESSSSGARSGRSRR